jgi:hypothetical protein
MSRNVHFTQHRLDPRLFRSDKVFGRDNYRSDERVGRRFKEVRYYPIQIGGKNGGKDKNVLPSL